MAERSSAWRAPTSESEAAVDGLPVVPVELVVDDVEEPPLNLDHSTRATTIGTPIRSTFLTVGFMFASNSAYFWKVGMVGSAAAPVAPGPGTLGTRG